MGFGARSADKWQLAIGRWKSKTKAKASQIRLELEKTGGGPVKATPLNQIEERLMALLGWRSVTGDRNLELGLAAQVPAVGKTVPVQAQHNMPSTSRARTPSPPPVLNFPEQAVSPPPLTSITRQSAPQPTAGLRGNSPRTRRTMRLTTERTRRMTTLSQMHRENLK